MIREADTDNDGEIDFNEFTKMILAWVTQTDLPKKPYAHRQSHFLLLSYIRLSKVQNSFPFTKVALNHLINQLLAHLIS